MLALEQYPWYDYRRGHEGGPADVAEVWRKAGEEMPPGTLMIPADQRAPHLAPGAKELFTKDLSLWLNTRAPVMPPLAVTEHGTLVFPLGLLATSAGKVREAEGAKGV